eukprot:4216806-Amphidinium_carterae.1
MTIGKLESHALLAASYSQESALLLCDFTNAFGAISRQWILHCIRRSGMCGGLLRFFLGGPQGGPLSPFMLILARLGPATQTVENYSRSPRLRFSLG